ERARATFEGILAIGADAIVCIDQDQRITFFSHGAEAIFGYSASEILGQPLDVLLPDAACEIHRSHVHHFAASGVTSRLMGERGQIYGKRKNGEIFPAEASISQLGVGDGRV